MVERTDTSVAADIEVTVIGGYLGAGKTTLVNHILRTADERVAVLVNDFGDVNIDADLIESEDDDTISLTNGCICCSLVDGFAAALATVKEFEPVPRRLVIEASGVADPAGIAAYGHGPGLTLDAVVVVVDAETVQARSTDKYVGDTVLTQLRSADILVLNKIDLVDPATAEATRAWLSDTAPGAVIVDSEQAEVAPTLLFGVIEASQRDPGAQQDGHRHDEPNEHHGEDVFESWSWAGDLPLERATVEQLMAALPDEIVRAKGVVSLQENPERAMVLQRVGGRWSLRPRGPWNGQSTSQIVLIGMKGAVEDGWLSEQLAR